MGTSNRQIDLMMQWTAQQMDGLNLFRCMPSEFCPQERAVKSRTRQKLVRGGNRSGKTTVAGAMFASIARDKPLTLHDGTQVHCRLDHQRKKPLVMWVVGYDWDHIGDPIHTLLFQENKSLFMIPDEFTGAWRAWRPWNDYDRANDHLKKPLPPLIPEHEIVSDSWVWKIKAANVFDRVELINGTVIYAHSSKEAKAGVAVDCIWVDEKIEYEQNVSEWLTRLIDRNGQFLWSTWPTSDNTALRMLSDKASREQEAVLTGKRKQAVVEEFHFRFSKNPFIDDDQKRDARETWELQGVAKARDDGEFMDEGVRFYPQFNMKVSAAIQDGELDDRISKILRQRNGEPPADWARFMILDPGTTHPAIAFAAVPPPELGDWRIFYDEIAVTNVDAYALMKLAAPRFTNYSFQSFIIDNKAGIQKAMSFGRTVADNYSAAMRQYGIRSADTDYGFIAGSPDLAVRSGQLADWMHVQPCGHSKLRIVTDKCPVLVYQLSTNKKKIVNERVDESAAGREPHDMRDVAEYFASIDPVYEQPVQVEREVKRNPAERMQEWLASVAPGPSKARGRSVLGASGKE